MKAKQDTNAIITSAIKLTEKEVQEVLKIATQATGVSHVPVKNVVDPSVLGGIRIDVGDWVFDTTISSQLKKLRNVLER